MKIELHLIRSVPPANLNRDDTGAPKDADFGGHRRARLSSQSLKRAIRTSDIFAQHAGSETGIRSRRTAPYLINQMAEVHDVDPEEARRIARAAIDTLLSSGLDEKDQSNVLYYAARPELNDLAHRLAEGDLSESVHAILETEANADPEKPTKEQKKAIADAEKALKKAVGPVVKAFVKAQKGRTSAADIALFGRMLAEEPTLNLEASCQVAHALSVDRVSPSFDYFTAVDDLKDPTEEDAGAGMIGSAGFNSAVYYQYAVIDTDQLLSNLAGDLGAAKGAVRGFLTAAVLSLPSGKQNSFAAQVRPETVMLVTRTSAPLSLVNAFANPIRPSNQSLAGEATQAMLNHWEQMQDLYKGLVKEEPTAVLATLHQSETEKAVFSGKTVSSVAAVIDEAVEQMEAAHA